MVGSAGFRDSRVIVSRSLTASHVLRDPNYMLVDLD